MTFTEHLEELRKRLFFSLLFLVLGCIGGSLLAKPAIGLLTLPFRSIKVEPRERILKVAVQSDGSWKFADPVDADLFRNASPTRMDFYLPNRKPEGKPDFIWGNNLQKPVFFSPLDPVYLFFHTTVFLGFILALPLILHQVWLFVAPGLRPNERRAAIPLLILGSILFPIGASFAYIALKPVLSFLVNFQFISLEPQIEIMRLIGFEMRIMLAFGAIFELPLIIMFLTLLGVVHPNQLRKYRPYAFIAIAAISMVLTPGPDPISMLLMMAPLAILYEVSIWLSLPLARAREANRPDSSEPR